MPSLRTLFTGLALLQLTTANPIPASTACAETTATLPFNGGPTELPASSLTLAYVAIGRGVQNYTCSASGATPVAIGAIATLYDATALATRSGAMVDLIPPKAVYLTLPKSQTFTLPAPIGTIKPLGHHYFDSAGTPVFDLSSTSTKSILFAAKSLGIKAPAKADKGPAGTGAVDWLFLTSKAGYTSVGLAQVYRVVTAGGVAPSCTAAGVESVEYAAEYWFYKP